ncbi:PAAR-like domain-containing protein [Agrobacterium vitis]
MSIPHDPYLGEPGYPGPWTTKQPREGLRDLDEARIVSLSPDVCWTPIGSSVVAIPYPIVDFCGHDQNYTPSVRFTGKKAMVMRSCTTHVHGDKPGVKKGVNSGTVESICEPVGHADQVRAEGSYVIRHLDRFKMNNGNTEGEAIFVRDTSTYDPPKDDDPVPGSLRAVEVADASDAKKKATDADGSGGTTLGLLSPAAARAITAVGGSGAATATSSTAAAATAATAAETAAGASIGTVLAGIGIFAVGVLLPTNKSNFSDFVPQDEFERQKISDAQKRINDLPFWDTGSSVREDTIAELRRRRQTAPQPQAVPLPQSETVRVDTPKCYVLPLNFSTPLNGTRAEMQRQLDLQQSTLNSKNPCVAANDIANYPNVKSIGEAARTIERKRLIKKNAEFINRINPNIGLPQAMALAEKQASNKDAIHTLDMIAGGKPTVFSGLGGRSENRSIGSQWRHGGKASALSRYAIDQCQKGCPKMQTILQAI